MPTDTNSWIWWFFTAVVLSIFVNIASDYIKPKVDLFRAKYSDKQKNINEKEEKEINTIVDNMLQDEREVIHVSSMLNYWYLQNAVHNILGLIALVLGMTMNYGSGYNEKTFIVIVFFLFIFYILVMSNEVSKKSLKYKMIYKAYRKRRGLDYY